MSTRRRFPHRRSRRAAVLSAGLAAALLLVLPALARAQDPRLEARIDRRTRAALVPIIDAARRDGLPVEPLVDKALEGASKRAARERIVAAVRDLATTLGAAREAIGRSATAPEIVAAADALEAGARPRELAVLRTLRTGQPITVPLAVLADLVGRGVPADAAADAVLTLARKGATDAQYVSLRVDVERDIGHGLPPATAVAVRAEAASRTAPVPMTSAEKQAIPER